MIKNEIKNAKRLIKWAKKAEAAKSIEVKFTFDYYNLSRGRITSLTGAEAMNFINKIISDLERDEFYLEEFIDWDIDYATGYWCEKTEGCAFRIECEF